VRRRGEGAPAISGVERGGAPGGSSAHKPAAVVLAGQLGEEDDRAGRAGWDGQRPRPRGGLVVVAQKEGRESWPARVEGEAGHDWAESRAGPEFKRNSFRISIYF
jgi:hypothetical protein